MKVFEANPEHKEKWDSFVETEGGSFNHYYDWKYIYEIKGWKYIPLILENKDSQIIAILPIVKISEKGYSILSSLPDGASGGFLFKKDIDYKEKYTATKILIKYIDEKHSKGCSTFSLKKNLLLNEQSGFDFERILKDNRFHMHKSRSELPCTYILKLNKPFEEKIWKEVWGRKNRKRIREAKNYGVHVKEDRGLEHIEDFYKMLTFTFRRLGSRELTKEEVLKRLTVFKNKMKLFVAFENDEPVASTLCYYTPTTCYWSKMPSYSQARESDVNRILLCEAIRDACNEGYQYFEFGTTWSPSLAVWKEHFRGTKISMEIYEKRYSLIREIMQKAPPTVKLIWKNRSNCYEMICKLKNKYI